ncbi:unnamed protein product [Caenorhabditis angaria]|uniref:Phospholipid/glycerol acyltransferase domain-containing protein n=1 Tax=Caenorhabditis angaria TaxID=860376 RepID=A0A9P1I4J0_9PELO|nr:unnamed protein product [Caenorhabditis angaria]
MLIGLTLAADSIKSIVPCTLLSASMVPFATCSIAIGGISWFIPQKLAQKLDNALYKSYMRLCLFVFENLSGVEIRIHGEMSILDGKLVENCVILSNHQSNVDWIIPVMLAARHGPGGNEQSFRVMVKKSIHFVPLFGWYIFQHGYIYVRRFGEFIGEPVLRQLKWLNDTIPPYWLLIFPEGTRLSAKKTKLIEESCRFLEKNGRPEMRNVLCPRSGGLQLALDNLQTLDAIYDLTVMYGQTRQPNRRAIAPGMLEFCCGPSEFKTLDIKIERFGVNEIPKEKTKLREWTIDRFAEKEKVLNDFYTSTSSPPGLILPTIPISTTLPSTIFFVSALILPIFSEKVRRTYIWTIASSPLLIICKSKPPPFGGLVFVMDISRQNPPQNVVSVTQHNTVETNLFILLLILAWFITFTFRRQIRNPMVHCATIIGIVIAVCTNPRHVHEINDFTGEFIKGMLPLMILFLMIELQRASRRPILPATSMQQGTNN